MKHTLTETQAQFLKNALQEDGESVFWSRKALTFVYSSIFARDGNRYLVATDGYSLHALRFDGVPDGFYAL